MRESNARADQWLRLEASVIYARFGSARGNPPVLPETHTPCSAKHASFFVQPERTGGTLRQSTDLRLARVIQRDTAAVSWASGLRL